MQTPDDKVPKISIVQTLTLSFVVLIVYGLLQSYVFQHFARAQLGASADPKEISILIGTLMFDARVLSYVEIFSGSIATLFIVMLVYLRKVSVQHHLRLYAFQKKDLISGFAVLVGFTVLLSLVSWLISHETSDFMMRIWESCDNVILLIIAVVIVAPIFEEMLFRGFIFTGIQDSHLGTGAAIVFSSALWTMIHSQYGAFDLISIFLLGILFAVSRIASGTLLIPIILHGAFNLFAILEMAMFT